MANTKSINAADIEKALSGADYPATKQELINYAKNNRAAQEVISTLNGLPNRQYTNSTDVSNEMGAGNMEGGDMDRGGDNM